MKNMAVRKESRLKKGVGSPKPDTCGVIIPKNGNGDGIREMSFNNKKIRAKSNLKPAE